MVITQTDGLTVSHRVYSSTHIGHWSLETSLAVV